MTANTPSKWATVLGRPVAYFPKLSRALGSINASIFLSQLIYWEGKIDREIGVYLSLEQWSLQTGMSTKELCTARKILRDRGLLIETEKRLEHKIYYAVNEEKYNELLESMAEKTADGEQPKGVFPKCRKGVSGETERAVRYTGDYNSRLQQEITTDTCHRGEQETKPDGLRPTGTPEKMVELYKAIACDKTDVRAMTDKRIKACEKVYKFARQYLKAKGKACEPENVYSWLCGAFKQVEKSSFLCGMVKPANGRKPFLLTFDWLMNVDNLTKLIEGQYSDD